MERKTKTAKSMRNSAIFLHLIMPTRSRNYLFSAAFDATAKTLTHALRPATYSLADLPCVPQCMSRRESWNCLRSALLGQVGQTVPHTRSNCTIEPVTP